MKVLLIGSGGREHALAWKIAQSPLVSKLYCAPGNAGIGLLAERLPFAVHAEEAILDWLAKHPVELVVIGPEGPLVSGLGDRMRQRGVTVFAPSQAAAAIEGSKVFMKDLCARHGVPTAAYHVFQEAEPALAYLRTHGAPVVVKASGLAAGKGVIVCQTLAEAEEAIHQIMVARTFGSAGQQVVIESCLRGEELSFLALVDGERVLSLAGSQDHKAVGEGDSGANTGGMGAYSPAPVLTPVLEQRILDEVMYPIVRGMAAEGTPYRGVLYAGLMIEGESIQVLEFNARFGDPETQPLLMRMRSDLVPLLLACANGSLQGMQIDWDARPALCVCMVAGGYPGDYAKGAVIHGLPQLATQEDLQIFHAGTEQQGDQVVTAGGRVLGVTALGASVADAQQRAYSAVRAIHWDKVTYRRDIGYRAIAREQS
jgi:phosphoribosylamine--glycine ligase